MSASTTWNASINRHAGATLRLAAMVVGNVCGLPDDDECDPETQRVMALAAKDEHDALVGALEAREAEVRYLRAQREWKDKLRGLCGCPVCDITRAENPEPQPPEGVEP